MASVMTDREGLEVLPFDECLELIASVPVGRFAMIDRGEIVVMPVNHTLDVEGVCFRTAYGAKFDAGAMQHVVAFEADEYDEETRTGWSVIVKGRADLVTDEDTIERLEAKGVHPWSAPDRRVHWVVVRPSDVTGRRISGE